MNLNEGAKVCFLYNLFRLMPKTLRHLPILIDAAVFSLAKKVSLWFYTEGASLLSKIFPKKYPNIIKSCNDKNHARNITHHFLNFLHRFEILPYFSDAKRYQIGE